MRRSWTEINLGIIEKNYQIFNARLPQGRELMAVVKADAYGHGDREVAARLYALGCRNFAVSNITEGIRVREVCGDSQILILGYTPLTEVPDLIRYDITQAVVDEEYAEKLAAAGLAVKVQFALDTGMNRIGLDADRTDYCADYIRRYAKESGLQVTGLFTHLCVADTPSQEAFTRGQIEKFEAVCHAVADLKLPYMHCLNTAGGIWYDTAESRLMRLGISLYGLKPDYANTLPDGIAPALTWKSVIAMVKEIHEGETVGYGRTFKATGTRRIATVPTGYADGYHRELSNKGYVLIRGKKAPIVGRVCMDQFMVDVTDIPEACAEDEVILIGRSGDLVYTADDMAEIAGTIGYEIVCDITKRVERNYI